MICECGAVQVPIRSAIRPVRIAEELRCQKRVVERRVEYDTLRVVRGLDTDSGEGAIPRLARRLTEEDYLVYPVVDRDDHLLGIVSLTELREVLTDQAAWAWLVASDVVRPVTEHALPTTPLKEALATMRQVQLDQMPVLAKGEGLQPVGLLDATHIRGRIEREILLRQGRLPADG